MIPSISSFLHLLLNILLLSLIKTAQSQTCQYDIPDFFYNVNFNGPLFDRSVYSVPNFSVASPIGTSVFTFNVQPQTSTTKTSFATSRALNNVAGVSITATDPNFSVIQLSNGSYQLNTATYPLNYYSPNNRYLFNLIATQSFVNRPPTTSQALVQISLVSANVHAPIFIPQNPSYSISETASINSVFGTVYASDADLDTLTYSIVTQQTLFAITRSTGVLSLDSAFPSTSASQYFIIVSVTDTVFTTQTNVTINVTAVNKQSPTFLNQICGGNFSFNEGNTSGINVTTISAFDNDRGANGQINITFPSEQARTTVSGLRNSAYSQFQLIQLAQVGTTRSAILQSTTTFDYDAPGATRVWYLFILATDNGTPQRQSFCSIRVNLMDINDNAPVFVMTQWNYTIYRAAVGNNPSRFLRIIASDADSGNNGIIDYYIGSTPAPLYFIINRTTGVIMLQPNLMLSDLNVSDFPVTFTVYARDRGTPPLTSQANATVTINFNNNNEQPPASWLDPRYQELSIVIREKFYEVYNTRPIFDSNFNGSIIYQLTSQQSSILTVTSPFANTNIPFSDVPVQRFNYTFVSGIAVTYGLHAEIQDLYVIYIRILVNPPLIGSATIQLIDENDNAPMFDIRSIVLSVVENEVGLRQIAQIQAFDRDLTFPNNFVQYRMNLNLTDPIAIGKFFVALDGTITTNYTFDRETTNRYRLFLTAYDGAPVWNDPTNNTNNPNTQDFQFDVQVIDVNDVPPVFLNSSIVISINETTAIGTGIVNITCTDTDYDTILDFGISSGNTNNVFSFMMISDNSADSTRTVYQATAQLYVVSYMSYETLSAYNLELFAFDTQNLAKINVTVILLPQNTFPPRFQLMPGFVDYSYTVTENQAYAYLNPSIIATDPDIPPTGIVYSIVNTLGQNLSSLFLNQSNNQSALGIGAPGLSRDKPFGYPVYNLSINATDNFGTGLSGYVSVTINVIDVNNNAPYPSNPPWLISDGVLNPTTSITFQDVDDPLLNHTIPFSVNVLTSPFSISPASGGNGTFVLTYNGILNRTQTKNITVSINASDVQGVSQVWSIPIIVRPTTNNYGLADGYKTISVLYVNGYNNALTNQALGSIHVNDLDDWSRATNSYQVISSTAGTFTANGSGLNGYLAASSTLYPGSYTVQTRVVKNSFTATGTVDLDVQSVDSEFVRQAATIRIQSEYPESLIDPTFGRRINTLRSALAQILIVTVDTIQILTIRSAPSTQIMNPLLPPLPFDQQKQQALTDVIFYVPNMAKESIENTLNTNLALFLSRYGIRATASGPNPCTNYGCPTGTTCRYDRTIQPLPYLVDTNLTSFVGINILDSADCVNSSTSVQPPSSLAADCITYSYNNSTYCPCTALQSYAPLGPYCEVLGRTFNANGGGYASFSGSAISNLSPTRFSFDFASRSPLRNGLLLLYGKNTPSVDDYFWTAIEIYNSQLRFHFGETISDTNRALNASTWYHVEYQFVGNTVLVSVNDCLYSSNVSNTTSTAYDPNVVQLYLGGLPAIGSTISDLYPSLMTVNTFNGCIRNVHSNGFYVDMSKAQTSTNSDYGQCSCTITNSCTTAVQPFINSVIVPWYTWLIIALVLLILATIIALGLLTCVRKRQQKKTLMSLYPDDIRENIIDYKETAGEEDHSAYNLGVLKKPVYAPTDDEIMSRMSMQNMGFTPMSNRRPSLGIYIEDKLIEQQATTIPYANDSQLHYTYEGEGSIVSDLSSIQSNESIDEHDYRFLYSWGPKFSRLADLYGGDDD